MTSNLQTGLWQRVILEDTEEQAKGKYQAWPIHSHFAHNMCLCSDCMDDWTIRGPNAFHSNDPTGTTALGRIWTVTQLVFPRGSRAQLWSMALPSICPICSNVFPGVIEHTVSGPNGLAGSVFCGDFSGLCKDILCDYNGDNLDTYSDCVILFFQWERSLFKRSKWGLYIWALELPVDSSGNVQFLYFLASFKRSFGL